MKHLRRLILPAAATLAFAACQALPGSAAADARPVPAGLADRLPEDTVLFVSMPDIPAMRQDMQKSTLARIFHEPDMQGFLGGMLGMLDEAWASLRGMGSEQGVPESLTHWDALRSFEMGVAFRPGPAAVRVFDEPPQIYALARLGLAEGLGPVAFDLIAGRVAAHGEIQRGPGGNHVVLMKEMEQDQPLAMTLSCTDDAIEFEILWGARGDGALAGGEHFKRAWNRNMTDGAAMFGFLRLDQIGAALMRGLAAEEEQAGEMLQPFYEQCLAPIQSISFASGWNDEGSFLNSLLDLRAEAGPAWRDVPLDRGLAAMVPATATAFSLKSSDSDPWMQAMLDLLDRAGALQPEGMPMSVAAMAQMQAPDLHDWLFGSHRAEMQAAMLGFGERSFSYSVPAATFGAETLTFVELDDAEAMAKVLEQLMPRLRAVMNESEAPVKLEMRRAKRKVAQDDGTIVEVAGPAYYWLDFEFPPEMAQGLAMMQISLQPAIGVAPEGWMVLSVSKDSVAGVLREGMQAPERDILANEDAAAFLASLPRGATSASWSDPRPAASAALGMVGGLLPMVAGFAGGELPIPLDLNAFPAPDVFVRNMRTSESWSWPLRGDFMGRSVGSMNLADLFVIVGAAVAVAPPIFLAVEGAVDMAAPSELEF